MYKLQKTSTLKQWLNTTNKLKTSIAQSLQVLVLLVLFLKQMLTIQLLKLRKDLDTKEYLLTLKVSKCQNKEVLMKKIEVEFINRQLLRQQLPLILRLMKLRDLIQAICGLTIIRTISINWIKSQITKNRSLMHLPK